LHWLDKLEPHYVWVSLDTMPFFQEFPRTWKQKVVLNVGKPALKPNLICVYISNSFALEAQY